MGYNLGTGIIRTSLSPKVLVLNQNYEPLSVCSVRKAVLLLLLSKAELVAIRQNKVISSVRARYPFPSVVRLSQYIRVPYKNVELTRKNILRRDNYRCGYCGRSVPPLTIDHIMPKSRKGADVWENLVTACVRCNNVKGDRTPEEAQMKLLVKAFRPNYVTFIQHLVGKVEVEWEPYLFMH